MRLTVGLRRVLVANELVELAEAREPSRVVAEAQPPAGALVGGAVVQLKHAQLVAELARAHPSQLRAAYHLGGGVG